MGFRLISFSQRPYNGVCFDDVYAVRHVRSGTRSPDGVSEYVEGAINDQRLPDGVLRYPQGSISTLLDLEVDARQREWAREVKAAARWARIEEDQAFITRLIDRGLGKLAVLQIEKSKSKDGRQVVLDRLGPREFQILGRRTVYCLPTEKNFVAGIVTEDFVEKSAQELIQYTNNVQWRGGPWRSGISFIREVMDDGTDTVLDLLIQQIHKELVKADIDLALIKDKPGPVLLSGPTGSGKSYVAKLLAKDGAGDGKGKLVEVNLSAVTDSMLESRMRGYVSGSFTGALPKGASGWFEEADKGVLFLDEFQSVGKQFQVHLLDVLNAVSNRVSVAKIGADHERKTFFVKVVLAVNEDIGRLVESGRLRKDLFYRMRQVVLFSSLRDRLSKDMDCSALRILLSTYRWKSAPTLDSIRTESDLASLFPIFSEHVFSELSLHSWPGNYRELERVAFDLFYDCDVRRTAEVREGKVKDAFDTFSLHISEGPALKASLDEESNRKLNYVERTLRKHKFVIRNVLPDLKVHHLGSRRTLKGYLIDHQQYLSDDILGDSALRKFMRLDLA